MTVIGANDNVRARTAAERLEEVVGLALAIAYSAAFYLAAGYAMFR
jgi:hypothetical protein